MKKLLIMGVAGCGKSTIAQMLSARLACCMIEADDYHPPANINKMRSGQPLSDIDRLEWLEALLENIDNKLSAEKGIIVACSALTHARQEQFIQRKFLIVFLDVPIDVAKKRLENRKNHFFGAELLPSQYKALEEPFVSIKIKAIKARNEIVDQLTNTISAAEL